jgi:hypothetical protein
MHHRTLSQSIPSTHPLLCTRRKARNSSCFMELLHNLRTRRGGGCSPTEGTASTVALSNPATMWTRSKGGSTIDSPNHNP